MRNRLSGQRWLFEASQSPRQKVKNTWEESNQPEKNYKKSSWTVSYVTQMFLNVFLNVSWWIWDEPTQTYQVNNNKQWVNHRNMFLTSELIDSLVESRPDRKLNRHVWQSCWRQNPTGKVAFHVEQAEPFYEDLKKHLNVKLHHVKRLETAKICWRNEKCFWKSQNDRSCRNKDLNQTSNWWSVFQPDQIWPSAALRGI